MPYPDARYPLERLQSGQSATVRFLPDGNPETRYWWVRRDAPEGRPRWLLQGFVVDSPIVEANPPACPIRTFEVGVQLYERIKLGVLCSRFFPWAPGAETGRDFIVRRTAADEFETSDYAASPRPLTQAETDALRRFGLPVLGGAPARSWLPAAW